MTNMLSVRSADLPQFIRHAIGVDRVVNRMEEALKSQSASYPPYNYIAYSEDKFAVQIAVAGFKHGDITIEFQEGQLTVKAQKTMSSVSEEEGDYIHRGISGRDFVRTFAIADPYIEVVSAMQEDGILTINLERKVPEEKKPKQIAITYVK